MCTQLRIEPHLGSGADDTSVNSMNMRCCNKLDWNQRRTERVGSGYWGQCMRSVVELSLPDAGAVVGDWGSWYECPNGEYIIRMRAIWEEKNADDTALVPKTVLANRACMLTH